MTIHIGNHAIAQTADGQYLSYYQSCWYVGKYDSLVVAQMALAEARKGNIKGVYAPIGTIPVEQTWMGPQEEEPCSDHLRGIMIMIAAGTHKWVKDEFGEHLEPVAGVPFAAYDLLNALNASCRSSMETI